MKKILKIAFLIMLVILIFQINTLYALYKNELYGTYDYVIGDWNIKLNDILISENELTTINASSTDNNIFTIDSNEYILEGKFAPSSSGTLTLKLDVSGTDVAVLYELYIKNTKIIVNSNVIKTSRFQVTGIENYFIIGDDGEPENNSNTYTENLNEMDKDTIHKGIIPLSKVKTEGLKNIIKIDVSWVNNEENNEIDTLLGETENLSFTIPINVVVEQYTGENFEDEE